MEGSRPGKRKSAGHDIIFEISDDDISSPEHIDNDDEPSAKVSRKDSVKEPNGNLKMGKEISLVLDNLMEKNKEQEAKEQSAKLQEAKEQAAKLQEAKEHEAKLLEAKELAATVQEPKEQETNLQDAREEEAKVQVVKLQEAKSLELKEEPEAEKCEEQGTQAPQANKPNKEVAPSTVSGVDVCIDSRLEEGELNDNENEPEINPCILIQFRDADIAELYKFKFLKFLESFIELETVKSDGLAIHIRRDDILNPKEWVVLDETLCDNEKTEIAINDQDSPSKQTSNSKRKKKNKKHKEKEFFTLDTTPSQNPFFEQSMKYASKFEINVIEKTEETKEKTASASTCFNCDGSHSLRDCTEPRNHAKINAARQKMKSQRQTTRYHLDEDQKYSHLVPGKISDNLREALGLKKHSIPQHVYMMRIFGYPPGWLEEAKFVYSNLSMFGTTLDAHTKKKQGLDPNKIIDYPGFNVPFEKGIKDDHRTYNAPPYSDKFSKAKMLEYFEKQFLKEQDDLTTCDMDLDKSYTEDPPEEETKIPGEIQKENIEKREAVPSPALGDLEQKRQTLLAALDDTSSNSDNKLSENNAGANNSVDTTGDVSVIDISSSTELEMSTAEAEPNIKTSSFGTPILKSSSQYSSLPRMDNFMKDVSPVINFENLPNSTGKYEQMTGLLQKVRSTMKNMQGCKS